MESVPVIGVIMDYFVPGLIQGAGAYAREHGLRLDARWSMRADWMPGNLRWDGLLVNLIDMENVYQRVMDLNLPVVHLGGWLGKKARPRVEPDYAVCGRLAVEEFHRLGIKTIAGMVGGTHAVDLRSYRGLRSAMRRRGIRWVELPRWHTKMSWTSQVGSLAKQVIEGGTPCGLFMPHAGVAVSMLDEFERLGARVPEDVCIIVIDKDPQRTSELSPVPLTGIRLDEWQQGYEACALLHRKLRGELIERTILRIPPVRLVGRASTGMPTSRDPLVGKVLHAIREHALGELEVSVLASFVGISRRNLEQRFRMSTGSTLHEAITHRRIEDAKRLLRLSEIPIQQVAEDCGYSSVHYFTTAFKRAVGTTPSAWKKESVRRGGRLGQ